MNKPNMVRAISKNGGVVLCAIDSTHIVRQMENTHKTSATVSAALGRLLTGASLMGTWLKDPEDSLTLRINGGGPVGTMVAVSDGEGNVRGYAERPLVDLQIRADGKLDVGSVVGRDGTLSVIRDMGLKEPYIGQIPLVSGEVAEDITSYYATSEQIPTVCALGVIVDKDLTIQRAGGYLLQLLPGAAEEEIAMLEENIQKVPSISGLLASGGSMYDIINTVLAGFEPDILDERRVEYRCTCNRERTRRILESLGRDELESMQQEDLMARVECHFCNKNYTFEIEELLQGLNAQKAADKGGTILDKTL